MTDTDRDRVREWQRKREREIQMTGKAITSHLSQGWLLFSFLLLGRENERLKRHREREGKRQRRQEGEREDDTNDLSFLSRQRDRERMQRKITVHQCKASL